MLYMWEKFRSVMFVVVDFGCYGVEVVNMVKDVVVFYKYVILNFDEDVDVVFLFKFRIMLLFF